jgi:hypothetical protein
MSQIVSQTDDGVITLYEDFTTTPSPAASPSPANTGIEFPNVGFEFITQFTNLQHVNSLNNLTDTTANETQERFLKRYYRISADGYQWSDYICIDTSTGDLFGFPSINDETVYLELKWVRHGSNTTNIIYLDNVTVTGTWQRNEKYTPVFRLDSKNPVAFYKPADIYKVFKIYNFEVISSGNISDSDLKISYRISQDSGRTFSPFENLTKANITTFKVNPIRFFMIEYKFESTTGIPIDVYTVNLFGDFQNVTNNYQTVKLYGFRSSCMTCLCNETLEQNTDPLHGIFSNFNDILDTTNLGFGEACSVLPENLTTPFTQTQLSEFYKPYALSGALNLYNSLSTSTVQIFGHDVIYFVTDPDKNAIDTNFREFQLFGIVKYDTIKASLDDNKFPSNEIKFSEWDLSIFENFEIQILKSDFKRIFGIEYRPSNNDFLFFCELNRMYQIEHAQPFKDFNNAAIYYRVVLKKYNKKANVQPAGQNAGTIADKIAELTNNTTIDSLFGMVNQIDIEKTADKPQFTPLSQDLSRVDVNVNIEKELIENASLVISKYHYDLGTATYSTPAVVYSITDSEVEESDNRAVVSWIRINNISVNETFSIINNMDVINNKGYKIEINNGNSFDLNFNGATFSMVYPALNENIWYCYTTNIDQRQQTVTQFLYQRGAEGFDASRLKSSQLVLLTKQIYSLIPSEFELENIPLQVMASDMRQTNLRLFSDVIPEDKHISILNQNIIRDTGYLIMADNSNNKVILPNYPPSND